MAWLGYSSDPKILFVNLERSKTTHFEGMDDYHWPMESCSPSFCVFLSSDIGKYKLSNSAGNLLLLFSDQR